MRALHLLIVGAFFMFQLNSLAINFDEDLGTLNPGATITRSGSTVGAGNDFPGYNSSPDKIFRIYIPSSQAISINTCGSNFDTYLYLVNATEVILS